LRNQANQLGADESLREVLKNGCMIVRVKTLDQAATVANLVAPEHLELHVGRRGQRALVRKVRNAGAIFVGASTPTVLGDFTAGPSHTLPTGRSARFSSGLKLSDFFRRSSVVRYTAKDLKRAQFVVDKMSRLESLEAHRRSLEIRFA
jgi:histidinol dehydrogenase